MMKNMIKDKKGITMISLAIAVTVIMIITGVILYNVQSNLKLEKLKKMQSDIENLREKVSSYFVQYGDIPAIKEYEYTDYENVQKAGVISEAVDTGKFYVIKLDLLENLTLNYGEDYKKIKNGEVTSQGQINELKDIYIINEDSHNIFYVEGIRINEQTYYTDYTQDQIDTQSVELKYVTKTDGSYDEVKKVNTPKIDSENGMELVRYDETTEQWVTESMVEPQYSYEEQQGTTEKSGTSKWANAKVTIDGVESYFVWIPRYAYKIDTATKTIDIKFIKGTGTEATDGTKCKYADDSTLNKNTDYIIHPAFTTNADYGGGWDVELPGIWIGKYESSRKDAGTTASEQGTSTIMKVQPGVSSFRGGKIGDLYTYAKAYSKELQSHMLKNSEWGAVAYLTYSKYGRNKTEVTINNNSNYLTGNAGNSVSESSSATTNAYNTEKGVLASSTGNVYGIYDLSGGAYEYVAAYYINGFSSYLDLGSSFTTAKASNRYSTVYKGDTASSNYILGDATYETSGWNNDANSFIESSYPYFGRGGSYSMTGGAGIFSTSYNFGDAGDLYGVRLCLVVK